MLKPSEREKLQDCLLLIQSTRNILSAIRIDAFPDLTQLQKCFLDADRTISLLLRS